jgi:hypothetical protein
LRTPPVRHTVHRHRRKGKTVQSYKRGSRAGIVNKYTKKLISIRQKPLPPLDHPVTPSGRQTENLCKLSKGQTLVWEDKHGDMRIILGKVSPKMKTKFCMYCDKRIDDDEEVFMTQHYFPFRHYFTVHNVFCKKHFPFEKQNLLKAEKEIEEYFSKPHREKNPFREGEISENSRTIFDLEQDVYHDKFGHKKFGTEYV